MDAAALRHDVADAAELVAAEAEIVAHMNADHADAVQLYATRLLGRSGDGWLMTGVDPEGADLRRGGEVARLDFDRRATTAEAARVELVRLVKRARAA
jgi:putative heme iron utilization protein